MLISGKLHHMAFDVGKLPSLALLLLSLEVGQFNAHCPETITDLLLPRTPGWLLLDRLHGLHRRHVHVLWYSGKGQAVGETILVLVWVLQLSRGKEVLILLLVKLARRDEVTPFLLRHLESSQFVLKLRDTVGMRQHLLASIRVETVVDRWCAHLRVERTLTNASTVWHTPTVVKLRGT